MKRVLTTFMTISSVALLMLSSCKKDETKAVATSGTSGTVTASASTLVLNKSKANASDTSIVFNYTSANYNFKAAVANTLQIDSMGDNWAKPQLVNLPINSTSQRFTTNDFNAILLRLKLPTDRSSQVQVRVASSISSGVAPVYTKPLTLTVTPYSLASYVYVPGAYQGWNPGVADSLVSPNSNGTYTGIINFTGTDPHFKVTSAKDWNHTNYGTGASAGTVSSTGGDITAPGVGGYLVTFDLNANTIAYTPQWSIIGDATPGGWGGDTNMFIDKATNTWYITATLVSDGNQAVKFRFKNDWTINLGGSNGTLSQNGSNINIPATGAGGAIYKITLDPVANTYTLTKQ